MDYETIIGLETHAELLTDSKLWCSCPTTFGNAPNTQTCPVCLGMPGVLPVMNKKAFELSVRAALALNCRVNQETYFDRKSYYYPDLPKNYQISQSHCNLGDDGYLEIPVDGETKQVGIWNVHLEEDAGKNIHVDYPGADYSLVDLNRAGTPLLEIVTAPDMRSVEEARAFMETLRQVLLYCRVSDCKMQEGSLRFEASISLRPEGSDEEGNRVEIKNLNSIRAVEGALEYEIERQHRMLVKGREIKRETRLWDEENEKTARMRSKELAQDYRYFPEPDLIPYHVSDEWLEDIRASLPELPLRRAERFCSEYGLSDYDADVLTRSRNVADYFEATVDAYPEGADGAKEVANWVMNEVLRECNERKIDITEFEVEPADLAELVDLKESGKINANVASEILTKMVETGKDAATLVEEEGAEQISDSGELEPLIEEVIEENPEPVEDYLDGKEQAAGALVGQVMQATRGKADPKLANKLIREKLDSMSE
ncbi:MAG: Asp-tRNA(Asn)/Glu-tRNA(Gln) amidotransferase subunit GatB [Planctomycetota bacterium]